VIGYDPSTVSQAGTDTDSAAGTDTDSAAGTDTDSAAGTDGDTAADQRVQRVDSQAVADARPPICPACGVGWLKRIRSRDTPENWLHVLCQSPFQPPWSKWDELDLADWTPVVHDDPPAQLYLPLLDDDPPPDRAPTGHTTGPR